MLFRRSKHSAFYFFLFFVFTLFSISLYKSVYAILSPKQLQSFLYNKLHEEVDLKQFELKDVEFHFFHRFFFRPTIEWKGLKLVYNKNCNAISFESPSLFIELDVLNILQKKIRVKNVNSRFIDFQILRMKSCEKLNTVEKQVIPKLDNKKGTEDSFVDEKNKRKQMSYVKNLPNFHIKTLKLSTEDNSMRYYIFHDLGSEQSENLYLLQSDLEFSNGTGLGFLPPLKLNGHFDEKENIKVQARLREASLNLSIESLRERNFKTNLHLKDFPLRYIVKSLKPEWEDSALSTHWLNLKLFTISHWDDFFAKKIPLQVEQLQIVGEDLQARAEPFTYYLKDHDFLGNSKIIVGKARLEKITHLWPEVQKMDFIPYKGIWKGELSLNQLNDLEWTGEWKDFHWFIDTDKKNRLVYDKAQSKGSLKEGLIKEEISEITLFDKEIEGKQRLVFPLDQESDLFLDLKALPNRALPVFEKSQGLDIKVSKKGYDLKQEFHWHGVEDKSFNVAKVGYNYKRDQQKKSKLWTYSNLIFKKENSFLNAIGQIHPPSLDTKSIYKAKRFSLQEKGEDWLSTWEILVLKPKQWIKLESETLSEWRLISAEPPTSVKSLAIQEGLFPKMN